MDYEHILDQLRAIHKKYEGTNIIMSDEDIGAWHQLYEDLKYAHAYHRAIREKLPNKDIDTQIKIPKPTVILNQSIETLEDGSKIVWPVFPEDLKGESI